jgi:iron-sulfur cluster assembly protein
MTTTVRERREKPPVLKVTDAAAAQLRKLVERKAEGAVGIRVGVKNGGCSGMAYTMDFAQERQPTDEVLEVNGVTVLVDPMAIMYLVGTEMDYVKEKLGESFVFRNPNETGRCGCGESFSVEAH